MRRDEVKEELLESHEEFRQLHQEHREYEQRLTRLQAKSALSPEDEVEAKRIKIHKLQLKDRMESIIRQHRQAATTA